ncbi:MAG: 5'-nucleotidase, lipoprotein e(P4) family [Vicinamibacterales bacterium]
MVRRASVFVLVLALAGCRSAAPPPRVQSQPAPPRAAAAEPDSIRWVRDAAEYRAAVLQVFLLAGGHVERAAAGKAAGSWAVVLDADETVISNLTYQAERARAGLGYSGESWAAWVRRREATPLPGAAAFLARVHALGGRIAIVTNRLGSECDDTIAVFTREHLQYDAMLCRPNGTPSDKNPRFEQVRTGRAPGIGGPVEVVAFLGDNIQDFPGLAQSVKDAGDPGFAEFGRRFFVLPNPMYGSWQ